MRRKRCRWTCDRGPRSCAFSTLIPAVSACPASFSTPTARNWSSPPTRYESWWHAGLINLTGTEYFSHAPNPAHFNRCLFQMKLLSDLPTSGYKVSSFNAKNIDCPPFLSPARITVNLTELRVTSLFLTAHNQQLRYRQVWSLSSLKLQK